MRKRGVPVEFTDWIARQNEGRTTRLIFDGFSSEVFPVHNGMDQGNPLSMPLYGFYCPDLLEEGGTPDSDELATAFVDDTTLLAADFDFEKTNAKLLNRMERPGGAIEWAARHHATFEIDKFALVHFSRKTEADPTTRKRRPLSRLNLILGDITIEAKRSAKLLGVHMDKTLKWKVQANAAQAKGMKYMMAAKRLSKGKRGVLGRLGAQLYTGVVVPKMLYAAEIWCSPIVGPSTGRKKKTGLVGFAKLLAPIQRMAGIFVTGAMKSTPTVALDAL